MKPHAWRTVIDDRQIHLKDERIEMVVVELTASDIAEEVNQRILEGWVPLGGISVCQDIADDTPKKPLLLFSQAMTREDGNLVILCHRNHSEGFATCSRLLSHPPG
jgi:hypothetical protein